MSADSVAMTSTYRRCTTSSAVKKGDLKQYLYLWKKKNTLAFKEANTTKAKNSLPAASVQDKNRN